MIWNRKYGKWRVNILSRPQAAFAKLPYASAPSTISMWTLDEDAPPPQSQIRGDSSPIFKGSSLSVDVPIVRECPIPLSLLESEQYRVVLHEIPICG